MKYCKNCGMLLEDSCDICIGCGLDTSNPDNVSKYPPKVEKKLEAERKQNKAKQTTIIAIVIVFILLLGLLCFILMNSSNFFSSRSANETENLTEQVAEGEDLEAEDESTDEDEIASDDEEITEAVASEESEEEEEPAADPNREVKDSEGSYYSRCTIADEGGNAVFTGLYPEDFKINTSEVDYSKYSVRFPGRVTFSVGNSDDTIHFTYLSPEQYWYKQSETGASLGNNRDIFYYMSFLTYEGGQGYADMLLNASYSDAKKVTLTETKDESPEVLKKIEEASKAFKHEMKISEIGDYGHIAGDTTYAVMDSECFAQTYHYEVVTKDKNTLFLDFYVPVMANNLYYSSKETGDRGTLTEWLTLGVYCFEAGNEDMYDEYEPAFEVFKDNCNLNKNFYNICNLREDDINEAISAQIECDFPDKETISGYSAKLGGDLSELENMMFELTSQRPGDKSFRLDGFVLNAKPEMSVAFVNSEKNKVFISTAADEYPGGGYQDMSVIDGSSEDDDESGESDDIEENEDTI